MGIIIFMADIKEDKKISNRILRIRGQVDGIGQMVKQNRNMLDILTQILAARSSLSSLAKELLDKESRECIDCNNKDDKLKRFNKLIKEFFRFN